MGELARPLINFPTAPFLQTLSPSINNVLNAIDKSLAERDGNIDKFCTHLDKDIAELAKETKEVKQESQVSSILSSIQWLSARLWYSRNPL